MYAFINCQASVKASPPQAWRLDIKYIHVQDVNKRCRPCFLIPEQVSEIHVHNKKIGKIDDVLEIYANK
jgi:hypothetical protein